VCWHSIRRWFSHAPTCQEVARERLQLVLAHDRADLTPGMLAMLKDDMIAVLRNYVAIDPARVEVSIMQEGRVTRLVADIPLGPARSSEESVKE